MTAVQKLEMVKHLINGAAAKKLSYCNWVMDNRADNGTITSEERDEILEKYAEVDSETVILIEKLFREAEDAPAKNTGVVQ